MDDFSKPTPYTFDKIDSYWVQNASTQQVSVGIYRMVPTGTGSGMRRESGNIRVKGKPSCPEAVHQAAAMICDALNAGRTDVPKKKTTVTAYSVAVSGEVAERVGEGEV